MPTRWREAWNDALYGPTGFFLHSRPTDHFRTSVTSSDVFAEAVARLAREAGLDAVVDLGAGGGELLARLHGIDPALRLTGVDLAPRPDLPDDIAWADELPATIDGLLIAHEWLDNIPCDVVELDDDGVMRLVEVDPDTGEESLGDPVESDWLERWWPLTEPGARAEIGEPRDDAWADAVGRVNGIALAVDYGHTAGTRPPFGSLASFAHGQEVDVVPDGSRDVTAHVAVDSVAARTGCEPRTSARRARPAGGRRHPPAARPGDDRPPGLRRRARPCLRVRRAASPRRLGRLLVAEDRHAPGNRHGRLTRMGQSREVTASLGSGFATTDMVLNIGPQHPATHGVLRLRLTLDGERVVHCEPIIGYMHRGVEKLFEVRDYRQIIVLANRHDWLSAFSSELGVAMAVEDMLGMEVPERATWIRTLLAELNRVLNHLMFLGSYPLELGAITPIFYAFRERETLQEVMEEVSGGRMHYMFNRVGGLKEDIPAGWTGRASAAVAAVRRRLNEIEDLVLGNEIFAARTKGVGVLTPELVHAYGVSGPIARASGVDVDLRRDEPYLAYGELADTLRVPTRTDGDCYSRFSVLLEQAKVSLDLADACLDRIGQLAPGPVNVRLPKIVKAPEGSTYVWTENPLGLNGYYLVSRGEKTPWRLKLRTASFNNVAVLPEIVGGCVVADLVAVLGSMFFVVGDIDK